MKKILFGTAAAICAVVGFSAFKTAKTGTRNYFEVTGGVSNSTAKLLNSQIVAKYGTTEPSSSICSGSSHLCVVSFTTAQLTSGGNLNTTLFGARTIVSVIYTQS